MAWRVLTFQPGYAYKAAAEALTPAVPVRKTFEKIKTSLRATFSQVAKPALLFNLMKRVPYRSASASSTGVQKPEM